MFFQTQCWIHLRWPCGWTHPPVLPWWSSLVPCQVDSWHLQSLLVSILGLRGGQPRKARKNPSFHADSIAWAQDSNDLNTFKPCHMRGLRRASHISELHTVPLSCGMLQGVNEFLQLAVSPCFSIKSQDQQDWPVTNAGRSGDLDSIPCPSLGKMGSARPMGIQDDSRWFKPVRQPQVQVSRSSLWTTATWWWAFSTFRQGCQGRLLSWPVEVGSVWKGSFNTELQSFAPVLCVHLADALASTRQLRSSVACRSDTDFYPWDLCQASAVFWDIFYRTLKVSCSWGKTQTYESYLVEHSAPKGSLSLSSSGL